MPFGRISIQPPRSSAHLARGKFWMIEGEIDGEEDDIFAMQNCLKLELGPRSDLRTEDHAVIRKLGIAFRGKNAWPQFRSLLPGYIPWFLTEPEARFLTIALHVVCGHCERIANREVAGSLREGECLLPSFDDPRPWAFLFHADRGRKPAVVRVHCWR